MSKNRNNNLAPSVYHRFEEKDLPRGLKPWPEGQKEPGFSGSSTPAPGVENGLYYKLWPDGQLHMVINVEREKIVEWFGLEEGKAAGTWVAGNVAQKYYTNGKMEDFHPWADNEPDYPADKSFETWVRAFLDGMEKVLQKGR